jgi:hypothetical protein
MSAMASSSRNVPNIADGESVEGKSPTEGPDEDSEQGFGGEEFRSDGGRADDPADWDGFGMDLDDIEGEDADIGRAAAASARRGAWAAFHGGGHESDEESSDDGDMEDDDDWQSQSEDESDEEENPATLSAWDAIGGNFARELDDVGELELN